MLESAAALRVGGPTWLHAAPASGAETVSELLLGEEVRVLEAGPGGWVRLAGALDGYTGWAHTPQLAQPDFLQAGVWKAVTALRGHVYAAPSPQAPAPARLSLGSRVCLAGVQAQDDLGRWWEQLLWPQGWAARSLFAPLPPSPLALAQGFIGTPYRWGGRSAWGVDCSGLTQVVYAAYGVTLPRDSGPQRVAFELVAESQPGDLAFFPGHVGLMLDTCRVLSATSYHMAVAVDTLGTGEYGAELARGLLGFGRPVWTEAS